MAAPADLLRRDAPGPPRRRRDVVPAKTSRSRWLADRAFRYAVVAGGIAIIASILGILVFLAVEAWPLVGGAEVEVSGPLEVEGLPHGAVVSDEYRETAVHLGVDGVPRRLNIDDARVADAWPALSREDGAPLAPLDDVRVVPGTTTFAIATGGTVHLLPVSFRAVFDDEQRRSIEVALGELVALEVADGGARLAAFAARADGDRTAAAAQLAGGGLELLVRAVEENAFTGEVTESGYRATLAAPSPARQLLIDAEQRLLFAALDDGRLALWELDENGASDARISGRAGSPPTAATLLIGDRALVVGRESGALEVWFPLRAEDGAHRLVFARELPSHEAPVRLLSPSMRNKGFVALAADGRAGLYHSTSRRMLWRGPTDLERASGLFFAPRSDGALVVGDGRMTTLEIDNPHPEVSLAALFGRVWYEGYEKPEYVWQSSSGSDDFEPKLSLTPLVVGTLKGTIYSLLLAIPLGVFGAMFASEFMHPGIKRYVKPTVEIMAALPSVVLGFLAGLWLAPRLEQWFPSLLLMCAGVPVAVVLTGLGWYRLPLRVRNRFPSGSEVVLYAAAIVVTATACIALSSPFESLAFGGSFPQWLFDTTGMRYDQRNAVVIGLAMGFAVIPIIFSVAEDAFSNVPRNLVSGSLALGANRWKTVTRVVLPTASPGIFSAIMIGFGRAVGETMIVLMATGNTPIMDWSPFNGFRTLSANIAVEIPEAPQGDTLYRTLFLAALLLFVITFAINTAAEVVRHRLRRRYANL